MGKARRRFTAQFKAKAALAAVKGDKTLAELASEFGVQATQISAWKKQLLEGANELFADGRMKRDEQPTNEPELYEQIGRLKMEVDWLKKKSAEFR